MSIRLRVTMISIVGCLALGPINLQAQNAPTNGGVASRPQLSGERLFLQCRACHSLTSDQAGKVGPPLAGVFSRGAGRLAGYDYSAGMRAYGGSWTEERLNAFLAGPNRTIAGTKMAFVGIPDAGRRAALIAYLRANTGATPTSK
jgi:cytochrome c